MLLEAYQRIIKDLSKDNQKELDIITHSLKRGEQNEELFSKNIRKILPKKMEIGNGFIVCSDPQKKHSREQDVVVYDAFNNFPLELNETYGLFPIEAVYGTIEVKTTLTKEELKKSFISNREIRDMAEKTGKFYSYSGTTKDDKGNPVTSYITAKSTLPPRFFIFAYS